MTTLDALAIIAHHGHGHYLTPEEDALLREARKVVRYHAEAVGAARDRECQIEAATR